MSLSGSIRECLQYLATVRGYSRATVENYDRTYHQFVAFVRSVGLEDSPRNFTTDTVMGFCSDLGARGAQPNTILNALARVDDVRCRVQAAYASPKEPWYGYGTTAMPSTYNRPGKLNAELGEVTP